ncbi:acylamino acid-releasing enzyme [Achlya hypogyna]|uniref:Acylamino acid-releasing enzyme n=1 Tax=Achlya hypogyna TaxID=1202772 RepID=A0A1V9Z9S7_ACHHY|nr:acylamino acid-releasing enzyme [Achlya hypogyna]
MVAEVPPLVPQPVLYGNAEFASPLLSPDGRQLAFLAPGSNGVMNVFVRPVEASDAAQLTHEASRPVRFFRWATNGSHLLYVQDENGNERFHLFAVHVATGATTNLTPLPGAKVLTIFALTSFYNKISCLTSPRVPDAVVVGLNDRDPTLFDVYRIDVITGTRTLLATNPGDAEHWLIDRDLRVRGVVTPADADGGKQLSVRDDDTQQWREIARWGLDEDVTPLQLNSDGSGVYVLTSLGAGNARRTQRLVLLSTADGSEIASLAHDDRADIAAVEFNTAGEPDFATVEYLTPEKIVLNDAMRVDLAVISTATSGIVTLLSRTLDDAAWTLSVAPDTGSKRYYVYVRATQTLTFVGLEQPALEHYTFAPMRAVEIPCADGETQVGYLTLPVGVATTNLPLLLVVHGGPWARDHWGFDPRHQWLANRGYAVLSVNYRASTGYGLRWLHLGNRQWGHTMQQDLTDAVHWAVREGFADPARIGIYGGSYGGYAVLAGLAFTPELFACGVDIVGPSNVKTLLAATPPDWAVMKKMFAQRIGLVETDAAWNEAISPLFHVHKMTKPVLIGQGANDPRVAKAESDQVAKALFAKGQYVEYVLYTDEGHGFHRPPNRIDFNERTEAFLAKFLGGRVALREAEATVGTTAVVVELASL